MVASFPDHCRLVLASLFQSSPVPLSHPSGHRRLGGLCAVCGDITTTGVPHVAAANGRLCRWGRSRRRRGERSRRRVRRPGSAIPVAVSVDRARWCPSFSSPPVPISWPSPHRVLALRPSVSAPRLSGFLVSDCSRTRFRDSLFA